MMPGETAQFDAEPAPRQQWIAELPLAGGLVVRFRNVSPDDEPLIAEAIRTSSRTTLLHRFFSPIRSLSPDMLRRLLSIDSVREKCIVGLVSPGGVATRIICGGRYVRSSQPDVAEIALTVHDDFQRQRLGTFLLKLLIASARRDGIEHFQADVLATNAGMLRLLRSVFPTSVQFHRERETYHVVVDLQDFASEAA